MITFSVIVLSICTCVLFFVRKNAIKNAEESLCQPSPVSTQTTAPIKKESAYSGAAPSSPAVPQTDNSEQTQPWSQERRLSERWRDWLAITTIIIAIMAAIVALEVSRFSTLAVLSTGKETNSWSYYQAKSVKEHTYQISKAALELQLSGIPGISVEAADKYRNAIKKYDEEIKRYKDEKDEIQEQALAQGKIKEKYQKLAAGFNNSLVFLQIAIVLSSIATLMRKKYIWYVSLSMLVGWAYFLINSF